MVIAAAVVSVLIEITSRQPGRFRDHIALGSYEWLGFRVQPITSAALA